MSPFRSCSAHASVLASLILVLPALASGQTPGQIPARAFTVDFQSGTGHTPDIRPVVIPNSTVTVEYDAATFVVTWPDHRAHQMPFWVKNTGDAQASKVFYRIRYADNTLVHGGSGSLFGGLAAGERVQVSYLVSWQEFFPSSTCPECFDQITGQSVSQTWSLTVFLCDQLAPNGDCADAVPRSVTVPQAFVMKSESLAERPVSGVVTGRVYDAATGAAIYTAVVEVINPSGEARKAPFNLSTYLTDGPSAPARGSYRAQVPTMTALVRATAPGYQTRYEVIAVAAGETRSVDLAMTKMSWSADYQVKATVPTNLNVWGSAVTPDGTRVVLTHAFTGASASALASGGYVWAVNLSDGSIAWKYLVGAESLGPAISPDGKQVAIPAQDVPGSYGTSAVHVLDMATGALLYKKAATPFDSLASVAYSPDGRYLAVGGFGGELYLFETSAYTQVWYRQLQAQVRSVAFSPDSASVYATSDPGPIYAYGLDGILKWRSYTTSFAYQDNISQSADGSRIAIEAKYGGFVVLDRNGNDVYRETARDGGGHVALAAPTGGFFLSTAGTYNGAQLRDATGRLLWWSNDTSEGAAFSSDLRFVMMGASLYEVGGTRLWSDATAAAGNPHVAVMSPDMRHLLTAGDNGVIYVFEGQTCAPTLGAATAAIGTAGGTGTVAVTVAAGCAWTAATTDAYITVTGGATGSGAGTVSYSVSANTGAVSRTGTITIAGVAFLITQSGNAVAPAVTTQPVDQSVVAGRTATFNAGASGVPTPAAQWQVSTNGGGTWTDVAGATSTSLSLRTAGGDTGKTFRVRFTNAGGTAYSSAAGLTVAATPQLMASPGTMRFGATKAGASGDLVATSPPVDVVVSFLNGTGSWTATADQPWIKVTGGSGSSAGQFSVSVANPGNAIGAGTTLSGVITVSAVGMPNSPVSIPVTLLVDQTGGPLGAAYFPKPFEDGYFPGLQSQAVVAAALGLEFIADPNALTFYAPLEANVQRTVLVHNSGSSVVRVSFSPSLPGFPDFQEAGFICHPQPGWLYLEPGDTHPIRLNYQMDGSARSWTAGQKIAFQFLVHFDVQRQGDPGLSSYDLALPQDGIDVVGTAGPGFVDPPGNATISGRLYDQSHAPIANGLGAQVSVRSGRATTSPVVDAAGAFSTSVFAFRRTGTRSWGQFVVDAQRSGELPDAGGVVTPLPGQAFVQDASVGTGKATYGTMKTLDVDLDAYTYAAAADGSMFAIVPFHTGLPWEQVAPLSYLTTFNASGDLLWRYPINGETPMADVAADGSMVASTRQTDAFTGGTAILLDATGKLIMEFAPPAMAQWWDTYTDYFRVVKISRTKKYLAAGDARGGLWVVDIPTGHIVWSAFTNGQVRFLAFNEDDTRLFASSGDGYLRAFDMTGSLVWKTYVDSWLVSMDVSTHYILTSSKCSRSAIHLIDKATGATQWSYPMEEIATSVRIASDESYVWYGSAFGGAVVPLRSTVFSITGAPRFEASYGNSAGALTADGRFIATANTTGAALFDKNGHRWWQRDLLTSEPTMASHMVWVSPDARRIVFMLGQAEDRRKSRIYFFSGDGPLPQSPHPADVDGNWQIAIGEVTAYGAAWKRGTAWSSGPNPIPIGHVTRAGYLWRNGETYHGIEGDCPACWVTGTAADGLPERPADGASAWATARVVGVPAPGAAVRVEIAVTPPSSGRVLAVTDTAPPGWRVLQVSDGGRWDPERRTVRWEASLDGRPRSLWYTCAVQAGEAASGVFEGTVSVDGASQPIRGTRIVGW